MHTDICDVFGIDVPIFAFTHCRDVVVAVSKAGGLGVLGAVGFSPEELEQECKWIDEHIGDKPYAVDTVIPNKYEGMGELDPEKLEQQLEASVPDEHDFAQAKTLLDLLDLRGDRARIARITIEDLHRYWPPVARTKKSDDDLQRALLAVAAVPPFCQGTGNPLEVARGQVV